MYIEVRKEYAKKDPPLPIVVWTVGQSAAQSAVERKEGYPSHHFLAVTDGEGVFTVGGECFTVCAGEGVFCRADVPHAYRSAGGRFATAWVTFYGGDEVLDFYGVGDSLVFPVTPALLDSLRELDRRCSEHGTVASRSAAVYAWLIEWLDGHFSPRTPTVERVRRFLEADFARPLTLDDISDALGMDKFALCRYYKRERGKTVISELRAVRVAKARALLRDGNDPVEWIAEACGFSDASYFCRIFRRETGMSPLAYRRTHR